MDDAIDRNTVCRRLVAHYTPASALFQIIARTIGKAKQKLKGLLHGKVDGVSRVGDESRPLRREQCGNIRLVISNLTTMRAVFPNVYLVDVGRFSNTMVIATKSPTNVANYAANIARLPQGSPLRTVGDLSIQTGNVREWTGGGLVFSDNRAPVELVIDRVIIDAARDETQHK